MHELDDLIWMRRACKSGAARAARTAAGLSLAEASGPADVDPSTLHKWESGQRVPHGPGALRYARVLRHLMTVAA